MSEFNREINGRTASREIFLYESLYAEILGEKDARLQKYLRKHYVRNDGKPQRKDKRKYWNCDFYRGYDTVRKFRQQEAERTNALDYAIEISNAEIDAEFEEWRMIAEAERLVEWLKWA